MNAPTLWILFPIALGIILLFINNQRALSVLGGSLALGLALIAQFVPIETALRVGSFSFRIESALNIFGRSLLILPAEGSLLALIYGESNGIDPQGYMVRTKQLRKLDGDCGEVEVVTLQGEKEVRRETQRACRTH